ncbi:acyl transferase/acyl hydrolase/lysophospholipase [Boeremia exigua]|uniref:acyl transferase/acyl hydrolase/lysophospholipase n=1 Tax=Boeremia exigua TaxID=749465 RepID=UPI001E8DBA7F|nr:acyl transferase/acyl hydrolase/lysophospholipase [Boeremia exigua]KAH6644845.1 acyl transferase/acyl hydrolase/lysophospholipase [Boeremia exigua]
MVYEPKTTHPNGLRLLALDGGGVRGIVALVLLEEVMKRVQKRKGLAEVPLPADYFELAAGTSTGGIIGIMLFRLRMSVADTITQYFKIGEEVFSPKVYGWNIGKVLPVSVASFINNSKNVVQDSRFDDASLKKAINDVVGKFGLDENDMEKKGDAPLHHPLAARAFCCTTAQNKCESVLLRTYDPTPMDKQHYKPSATSKIMAANPHHVTISLAARATSAAPTFFPEVHFPPTPKPSRQGLTFWDGGLLNNNPIDQLWYARYELTPHASPPPRIASVLSLGTGYIPAESPGAAWFHLSGVVSSVMDFSTNTNAKAKDFTRHVERLRFRAEHGRTLYVRLNPRLEAKIGLADYTRMEELRGITKGYLAEAGSQEWVEKAVCGVCCEGCEGCK